MMTHYFNTLAQHSRRRVTPPEPLRPAARFIFVAFVVVLCTPMGAAAQTDPDEIHDAEAYSDVTAPDVEDFDAPANTGAAAPSSETARPRRAYAVGDGELKVLKGRVVELQTAKSRRRGVLVHYDGTYVSIADENGKVRRLRRALLRAVIDVGARAQFDDEDEDEDYDDDDDDDDDDDYYTEAELKALDGWRDAGRAAAEDEFFGAGFRWTAAGLLSGMFFGVFGMTVAAVAALVVPGDIDFPDEVAGRADAERSYSKGFKSGRRRVSLPAALVGGLAGAGLQAALAVSCYFGIYLGIFLLPALLLTGGQLLRF